MNYPQIANRSCDECIEWVYRKDGERAMGRDRKPLPRDGKPPPCHWCPKCRGESTQSPAVGRRATLSRRNQRCLAAYFAHQTGCPPGLDPVARRNFGLIAQVFDQYTRSTQAAALELLAASVARP